MAFFDKLGDLAKNLGDKTTDAIETNKLNGKITAKKTAVAECMRKIGESFYQRYKDEGFTDDKMCELFTAIDGHNAVIEEAQAAINGIKEAAAAAQQPAETPASIPAPPDEGLTTATDGSGSITCACGQSNPTGTRFCGSCGGKLDTPAPPPAPTANRFCTKCGTNIPDDSRFCPECGQPLS